MQGVDPEEEYIVFIGEMTDIEPYFPRVVVVRAKGRLIRIPLKFAKIKKFPNRLVRVSLQRKYVFAHGMHFLVQEQLCQRRRKPIR